VTNRTRNDPDYNFLPPITLGDPCDYYKEKTVSIVDYYNILGDVNVVETREVPGENFSVNIVTDTFYIEKNINYQNIDVEFLTKVGDDFEVFDIEAAVGCTSLFDARMPVLTDKERPLEGTIKYKMPSTGFQILFNTKTLKLRVKIRDRAFNESNIIETPAFTLNSIRK
jgi:hypothetical protein